MNLTVPQMIYAAVCTLSIGHLLVVAPSGRLLVGAPPPVHATHDPSVRAGSAGSHSYFFWGGSGGYHGGK